MLHGDVRDVGAPNLIRPRDRHASEQIGINPVCRVRIGGSGRLINRFQAHQPHEPANPVTAHYSAFAPQLPRHLPGAVEGILHEQLVDPAHQHQILGALTLGPVIK